MHISQSKISLLLVIDGYIDELFSSLYFKHYTVTFVAYILGITQVFLYISHK
jgi:hypothetical protein